MTVPAPNILPPDHTRADFDFEYYGGGEWGPIRVPAIVGQWDEVIAPQAVWCIKHGWEDEVLDPCPYTFAHTRQWCGYDTCRES